MAQAAPLKTGASRSRKNDDPSLGRVIAGRYRLESRIGEGGMGIVYRARHVLIDRVVAVKLIRPDLRGETHLRAWMLREARAANRVDHALDQDVTRAVDDPHPAFAEAGFEAIPACDDLADQRISVRA